MQNARVRGVARSALVAAIAVGAAAACSDGPGAARPAAQAAGSLTVGILDARSLDGVGARTDAPHLGAIDQPYARWAPARYADGIAEPVAHPSERAVSNRVFADGGQNVISARGVTHWASAWGQFVDHDLSLRERGDESVPIGFDAGDPLERYQNDLGAIAFTRSAPVPGTGHRNARGEEVVREQRNTVSSYLDGSAVYGSTPERLDWLRVGPVDGNPTNNDAHLLTEDGMLPTAADRPGVAAPEMDLDGRLAANPTAALIAGDRRADENWALASVQTLFVREHNRIVDLLPAGLAEEAKFQIARRVVVAELQHITYHEYLPALGVELPESEGFDPTLDPTISNEFATAAFRLHSQVHGELELEISAAHLTDAGVARLIDAGLTLVDDGYGIEVTVPLHLTFGTPELLRAVGVDAVLVGLASETGYANDETIDDMLRSVLFEVPRPDAPDPAACLDDRVSPECFHGVIDLGAIDIARGYDHGLPTYNELRRALGLDPVRSFEQLTGETTAALPDGLTIDDPAILDIVDLRDARNRSVAPGSAAAATTVVRATRRTTVAARLAALYDDVDAVDAFTGMQVERRVADTELGELQHAIWVRQFTAIRDGDPNFSDHDALLAEIEAEYGLDHRLALAEIIELNAGTARIVPADAFRR